MSPRIERAFGAIFGIGQVRQQKEASDRDPSQGPGYEGGSAGNGQSGDQNSRNSNQQKPPVDRETVERAMKTLRESAQFSQTGMRVELLVTKEGIMVKLTQASGATIKTMTADEFVRLDKTADGEQVVRGKILDQKF